MSARNKILAAVAGFTLLGGIGVLGAAEAQASTTGCAFSNGCATLHGTDAASDTVAMDTKYQNKNEIVIGYPDNAGDGATSYDGVLHYGKGAKVTSYVDTGLQVSNLHSVCTSVGPLSTPMGATIAVTAGNPLTVENSNGTNFTADGPATSLPFSGTLHSGTVVDENYGSGCVLAYTFGGLSWSATSTFPAFITLTFPGGSVTQFNDTDTGTFSFTGLPAGVSQSGGKLTADTSTAHPGTYSSVGVTFTDTGSGSQISEAFVLTITGIKSTTPGAGVPFYTFVYAPHGDWTSQCVTDINGSGALTMAACTAGKDTGQDFTIGATTPGLLSGSQAPVRNLLAEAANPADSYLTDPSTSNPATPQSDAADERAPGGRQLYVNGTDTNLWSWGT
jgi:hypothetical protein